jgi:hypothetical protein
VIISVTNWFGKTKIVRRRQIIVEANLLLVRRGTEI